MSVTLSHVSSSRSSLAHACLLWRNTVQQRWMRWRHVHSTEELKYANRFTCQLTVGMSDHDGPTANMRVTSSLPHHANRAFLVPKRFRACGILGELAEQGGPPAPVRVPFSERALGVWSADESVELATVRQEVAAYVEVLEVRRPEAGQLLAVMRCCEWQSRLASPCAGRSAGRGASTSSETYANRACNTKLWALPVAGL